MYCAACLYGGNLKQLSIGPINRLFDLRHYKFCVTVTSYFASEYN